MSEEAKKEEKKKCGACLNVDGNKPMSVPLVLFGSMLLGFGTWCNTMLLMKSESSIGWIVFFIVVELLLGGIVLPAVFYRRLFGSCVYCFSDKAGHQHHHKNAPSTRLNAEGKTVYYFVPENAPSNAPLEDWDIPGPIIHLHLASWRSDSRVLNVEAGCADDLTIDRVKVVGEGEESHISLSLRRRSWNNEEFVVSVASALKIIGEAAVKSSLAEHLFERIKDRQFWLDDACECARRAGESAEKWKKVAVGSCARIRFTKELLDRFEAALAASKKQFKSKIAGDARSAVSRLKCSYVVNPLSGEEQDLLTDPGVTKKLEILLTGFDQSSFDVELLRKGASASIETPPVPMAQRA